ncbi:hypothetical protein HUK83_02285 [Endobacter medicaginis]|nr:hypothetical protein [Endobacter medicaginis]
MSRNVVLYAQYHPHGHLLPHARASISALLDAGCIVHAGCAADAVTGVPADREARGELERRGAVFHQRRNAGLDFGSWQELLRLGCARGAGRVLLVNDSTLGPLRPIAPILDAMRPHPAWGMVASRQIRPHLQSWFVCLDAALLETTPLTRIFAQDFASMSREEIILHGEIGLSAALEAARVTPAARWTGGRRHLGRLMPPTNPAHVDWRRMLRRVPFVKIELLRDDPSHLAPPAAWHRVLRAFDYPLEWAEAAIAAVPARRQPVRLNWRGRAVHRLLR